MSECLLCVQEQADPATQVFVDDDWAAGIIEGYDVPGWAVLRIRRHAVGIQGLGATELAAYGRRLRDLVSAVSEVTRAEATYMLVFGEANPHFHVLVTPRTARVPADRRGGDILKLRYDHVDRDQAMALIPALRVAYATFASQRSP